MAATTEYESVAGNESTITVNVVSTFLLALLILPKLQETARNFNLTPTLTIVSSEVHFVTSVSKTPLVLVTSPFLTAVQFPERKAPSIFGNLNDPKEARMDDRYHVSKLLEVLACREVTREHPIDQMKVALNFVRIITDQGRTKHILTFLPTRSIPDGVTASSREKYQVF